MTQTIQIKASAYFYSTAVPDSDLFEKEVEVVLTVDVPVNSVKAEALLAVLYPNRWFDDLEIVTIDCDIPAERFGT